MEGLRGKVAVVTGASRGAGRGIALELGEAGATVYVTGRSVRGEATGPGTIEETAEAVTARGGLGIPVRVDHTVDAEVEALFRRVQAEQGRLDLLVNNVWGGNERSIQGAPFWELSLDYWDAMFTVGVRAHVAASRYAVPLMLAQGQGLIINTTFDSGGQFTGDFWYDLAKNAISRAAFGMAQHLKQHQITALSLSPGWMRTELVLREFSATEENWQGVEALAPTESPRYIGRAVVALAGDPAVFARTGQALHVGDLAREYGFTDIDGRQVPRFST